MIKIYQGATYMKRAGNGWLSFASYTLVIRILWCPVYCHTWEMETSVARRVFRKHIIKEEK